MNRHLALLAVDQEVDRDAGTRIAVHVIGFAEQLSWALYRLDRKEYGHDLGGDAFLYPRAAVVAAGRTEFDSVLEVLSLTSVSGESLTLMCCALLFLQSFSRAHLPTFGWIEDGSW